MMMMMIVLVTMSVKNVFFYIFRKPKPEPTTPTPTTTTEHRVLTSSTTEPTVTSKPYPTTSQTSPKPTVGPIPEPPTTTSKPSSWYPTQTEDTHHWMTTTDSAPVTTDSPEQSEGFTTISPEIQQCIDSCLSTPEYNPVCGSDGVTYNNEGKLFCAAQCGVSKLS